MCNFTTHIVILNIEESNLEIIPQSPPPHEKNALLKVPQKISTKKKHNLLIKVYRYHLSENDPLMIKKISTIVDVANTEKNLKKTKTSFSTKVENT